MRGIREHFDAGSLVVIALTLVLFVVALLEKGFTHDMLLEAGVFLISVKLIMMAYKIGRREAAMEARLAQLTTLVERIEQRLPYPNAETADRAGDKAER